MSEYSMTGPEVIKLVREFIDYDLAANNPGTASELCSEPLLATALWEDIAGGAPRLDMRDLKLLYMEDVAEEFMLKLRRTYPFFAAVIVACYS